MLSKASLVICLIVLYCFNIEAIRTLNTSITPQGDPEETNHCYAIVRTNDPNSIYVGASGFITVYVPTIHGPEWSAARIRLQNGDNFIEAGWMVNEDLFKDNKTHLYIRYMVGGRGCLNLECPGFVQVSKEVLIGATPDKVSHRGQELRGLRISISKHTDDGNWWLMGTDNMYDIGYWPKSLFTSLADHANQIEWGGEVYYPGPGSIQLPPPEMGAGYKPQYDPENSAFCSRTKVVDGSYRELDPPDSTVKYTNCRINYIVQDMGYTGPERGRVILFGGPNNP